MTEPPLTRVCRQGVIISEWLFYLCQPLIITGKSNCIFNRQSEVYFIVFIYTSIVIILCNQEFDNADGEECSGGSSPIQEDSLSSCASLPEVYTLPVRERPSCPALQDGAGNSSLVRPLSQHSCIAARVTDVDSINDSNWVFNQILNFSGVEMWENCASVPAVGQIGFCLLLDVWAPLAGMMMCSDFDFCLFFTFTCRYYKSESNRCIYKQCFVLLFLKLVWSRSLKFWRRPL